MNAAPLVEAHGLVKRFGDLCAVDGIDVRVETGEAFGFLGPNGAGKTSTMRMIACVSAPTAGTLRVLGMDPRRDGPRIRARLGVVHQEDTLDLELSVRENLLVFGRYFSLPRPVIRRRADELLAFVQLADRRDDRVDALSGGMRRRLSIARALINEPDLLLLDEPTTGLDPQARHLVWDRLHELKETGTTLVLTTHYMDEAEQLCDRLVIMDGGRIVAEGTPRDLIETHVGREVVDLRFADDAARDAALARLDGDRLRTEVLPRRLLAYTDDGDRLVARLTRSGLHPAALVVRRASLEDVFLTLTGRSLEE